jgi:hypothetical protein
VKQIPFTESAGKSSKGIYRQLRKEMNFHEPISPENTANAGNES